MNYPYITLWGYTVYPYGLWVALGLTLMLIGIRLSARRFSLPRGTVPLMGVMGLALGFICSRVVYCLTAINYFVVTVSQPAKMLNFWDGGYSLLGAGIGFALGAWIAAKALKLPVGRLWDAFSVFAGVAVICERLGEQYTYLGLGREIQTQWLQKLSFFAVEDSNGYICHAVYRYEAVIAAVILLVMLYLAFFSRKTKKWQTGDLALVFITLYASAQVLLESLRDDGHMMWGFVRANQIYAALLAVAALILITRRMVQKEGITWRAWLYWAIAAASIGVGILKEFAVDSSANLWADYGIMALALVALAVSALLPLRRVHKLEDKAPLEAEPSV